MRTTKRTESGFSLVEVVIVSALVVLVFGALLTGVRTMVVLIADAKAEAGARALAVSRLEYIRSLPYDEIGTVGGIPSGPLSQSATTTVNGVTYVERTLIQYIDRPEDGLAADDENGVTADSKSVRVVYDWNVRGEEDSYSLSAEIAPTGIESLAGGGTLEINVFNADVLPVAGAAVRVQNNTGTSTIDVTVYTNESGRAYFPGAPALTGYEISATADGYSTDQTYSASSTNENPNPPHVSVIAGEVSSLSFAIDELSRLTIVTKSPPETGTYDEIFSDDTGVYEVTDVVLESGELRLAGNVGSYEPRGTFFGVEVAPETISAWNRFTLTASTTADTSVLSRFYSVTGSGTSTSYTLIPDEDLPGNTVGFASSYVDLSELSSSQYPRIAVGLELQSSDVTLTPTVSGYTLSHTIAQPALSAVPVGVAGAKEIGEYDQSPVYKYDTTHTTDGTGEVTVEALEWDQYTLTVASSSGYDISAAYPPIPLSLDPGTSATAILELVDATDHSLRVTVLNGSGSAVADASVTLSHTGDAETVVTPMHGNAFFSDLTTADNYTLNVTHPDYTTEVVDPLAVEDATTLTVTLTE